MIKKLNKQKGMTLIELIVAVAIFTIVIVILSSSILYFYRTNSHSIQQIFAIESARGGVESMVRDIREITYSDEGSYPVIEFGPDYFYFYSDIDRDNDVERVQFFIEDSDLKKAVTKPSGDPLIYDDLNEIISVVSDKVRNSENGIDIFSYYDDSGIEITDFSRNVDVAFVKVNLIVNIDPNRNPDEFTIKSSATLRNLKTNL